MSANIIKCDAERVQGYLWHKAQYSRRIEHVKAKLHAAARELNAATEGLERIQVAFIDDATQYAGDPYVGIFPDGAGGFVHVTAQKANQNARKPNVLKIEKVIQ